MQPDVSIGFVRIRGLNPSVEQDNLLTRVQSHLARLLASEEVDGVVGRSTGLPGAAILSFAVPSRSFAEERVLPALRELNVDDQVRVRFTDEDGEITQLHPDENR